MVNDARADAEKPSGGTDSVYLKVMFRHKDMFRVKPIKIWFGLFFEAGEYDHAGKKTMWVDLMIVLVKAACHGIVFRKLVFMADQVTLMDVGSFI